MEIEYFIYYFKYEKRLVFLYVNSVFLSTVELNRDIVFFNSSLDSKWRFLSVGLRLTSIFFLIHKKKIENLHLLVLL